MFFATIVLPLLVERLAIIDIIVLEFSDMPMGLVASRGRIVQYFGVVMLYPNYS
jgi:hypothetical protein